MYEQQLGPVLIVEYGFGLYSLELVKGGRSLPSPDGLLVGNGTVEAFEYSTLAGKDYYNKKRRGINELGNLLPCVFGNTGCSFVVTRNVYKYYKDDPDFADVKFKPAPYYMNEFNRNFDLLFPRDIFMALPSTIYRGQKRRN
jgi:hypothetical protein